jgi:hypothetical protein
MIRGINGLPYIDLDPYLDIEGFVKLHNRICKGIVNSEYKKEGNIVEPGGCEIVYDKLEFKPLFMAIKEYEALPIDHEIRVIGREIGEWENRDKFVLYLKLVLGGYDPYQFIFLKTEQGGWLTRFEEKSWTPDIVHFPELRVWLENLVSSNVFKYLGRIIFFKAEHDCIMPVHRDLILPDETEYTDHRHEFIHLRSNADKPFYIWDSDTDQRVSVNSYACFFNDQDWHSGGKTNIQTYSIRIDGQFTDEFSKKIGIDHIEFY